jgi:hypothetical protein
MNAMDDITNSLTWWEKPFPMWQDWDTPRFTAELLAVNTFEVILNERSLWAP